MQSEYFSYVEQDKELFAAVEPALPGLRGLSAAQVETLVFYLKSLHAYYPASENHVAHYEVFGKKLEALRNSPEQKVLEARAARLLFAAMALAGASGMLLAAGVLVGLGGNTAWGVGLGAAALALFVTLEGRFGKRALEVAKEQDRRYFLRCLRISRACNELDWSGLFSYGDVEPKGPQSDADLERTAVRVGQLSAQLRDALYNDEFLQFSLRSDGRPH